MVETAKENAPSEDEGFVSEIELQVVNHTTTLAREVASLGLGADSADSADAAGSSSSRSVRWKPNWRAIPSN